MFTLTIKTGGAAFRYEDYVGECGDAVVTMEIVRLLRKTATELEEIFLVKEDINESIMDINGNKVGSWKLEI